MPGWTLTVAMKGRSPLFTIIDMSNSVISSCRQSLSIAESISRKKREFNFRAAFMATRIPWQLLTDSLSLIALIKPELVGLPQDSGFFVQPSRWPVDAQFDRERNRAILAKFRTRVRCSRHSVQGGTSILKPWTGNVELGSSWVQGLARPLATSIQFDRRENVEVSVKNSKNALYLETVSLSGRENRST